MNVERNTTKTVNIHSEVPEGWQLVPIIPTPAMITAALNAVPVVPIIAYSSSNTRYVEHIYQPAPNYRYKAMLEAAPQYAPENTLSVEDQLIITTTVVGLLVDFINPNNQGNNFTWEGFPGLCTRLIPIFSYYKDELSEEKTARIRAEIKAYATDLVTRMGLLQNEADDSDYQTTTKLR